MMKNRHMAGIIFAAISSGATADECLDNFAVSGNFFSGKQYKTAVTVRGQNEATVFKRTYASIAKKGYQITESDKDVGIISAAQPVSYSEGGKSAPLNAMIEAEGEGSRLSLTFSTAGGLAASANTVREEFCKITAEVIAG